MVLVWVCDHLPSERAGWLPERTVVVDGRGQPNGNEVEVCFRSESL